MNNFHIYEEVGRGKDSVVYKVKYSTTFSSFTHYVHFIFYRVERKRQSSMSLSSRLRNLEGARSSTR